MHATVVKLDALTDPVRPPAEHHDFLFVARTRLALFLIGRVHVGGARRKFRGTGIDSLVNRADAKQVTTGAHLRFGGMLQLGMAAVGEALALQFAQGRRILVVERHVVEQHLQTHNIFNLRQEPRIDVS